MVVVTNKKQNFMMQAAGAFGPRLRCWTDVDDYLASGLAKVTIRYQRPGSSFCRYDVPRDDVLVQIVSWMEHGADPRLFTFNEGADDRGVIFQGEVIQSPEHLSLYYSTMLQKMRPALQLGGQHAFGLTALSLIQYYLTPSSLDDLWSIFEHYQNPVVEFSTYKFTLEPGRNTIFWEARSTY